MCPEFSSTNYYYLTSYSVPKLVDEYLEGKIPLEDFVTDRMKLDDINEVRGECQKRPITVSKETSYRVGGGGYLYSTLL